jgi:ribosome-associated toxin RatA of RatAB toxin-antitoxin module
VRRNFTLTRLIAVEKDLTYKEIANFKNYVNFIPGCTSANLIKKNNDFEIGELKFDFMLKNYSIKSKNILKDNSIEIQQIEGPFEYFNGEWTLNSKEKDVTEIRFDAEFELPFLLDNLLPDHAINMFIEEAMKAFIKRLEVFTEN